MIRRLRKCKTARLHYFRVVPEKNRTQIFIFSVKSIAWNFSWKWFHGKFLAINKSLIFFTGYTLLNHEQQARGLIPSGALRPLSKLICLNAGHFKEKYVCSLALQILCAYFWKKYLAIFTHTHKYIIIFSNLEIHVEIKRGVSFGKKEY